MNDPIISVSSGLHCEISALSLIRISLGDYGFILKSLLFFLTKKKFLFPRLSTYSHFYKNGVFYDDGIIVYYPSPNSYDGYTVIEITIHGNSSSVLNYIDYIVSNFSLYGMRYALRGEYTKRAFLNGKIDLFKLSSIYCSLYGSSSYFCPSVFYRLRGYFLKSLDYIFRLRLFVCNSIDFDSLSSLDREYVSFSVKKIVDSLSLIKSNISVLFNVSSSLPNVSIVGNSNVGKSSIFNRIVGFSRSIVSCIPGTTRDYVKEKIDYKGVSFNLIDTAGFKTSSVNSIDFFSLDKSKEVLRASDIIIFVSVVGDDSFSSLDNFDNNNIINVYNKIDLLYVKSFVFSSYVYISCKSNIGILNLINLICNKVKKVNGSSFLKSIYFNRLFSSFDSFLAFSNSNDLFSLDKLSFYLQRLYSDIVFFLNLKDKDVSDFIFSSFCVGK